MKVKCFSWYKSIFPLEFKISGYNECLHKCIVQIKNYQNEIFVEVSIKNFTEQDLLAFVSFLEKNSIKVDKNKSRLVKKFSLYGYLPMFCYNIFVTKGFIKKTLIDHPFPFKIFHEDVDERVKFCTDRNIKFCKWIEIKNCYTSKLGNIDIYECRWDDIEPVSEEDPTYDIEITPKIFYFDIECEDLKGEDDEEEESLAITSDNIIQISIVCQQGKEISLTLLSLFPVDEKIVVPDGYTFVKVEHCKTQKRLLLKFFDILSDEDPDIISGYNILEFDWKRIFSISQKVGIDEDIYKKFITKSKKTVVRWISKTWESSAYSKREFFYPEIEGRSNLDIIQHVKRNYRLPSYSLNNVVKNFLVDKSKLDVDYKVIKLISKLARECYSITNPVLSDLKNKLEPLKPYRFYSLIDELMENLSHTNTVEGFLSHISYPMSIIGRYCIVDSLLCLELMETLQILSACEEIANCTYITLEDVLCRGNQYRIFNLLYSKCYSENVVLTKPEGKFEKLNNELRGVLSGALVLDPVRGHHRGVITLDFASLYPNIIINYNLCYTTLCLSPSSTTTTITSREGQYYFEKERKGILPRLETELIEQRRQVKKQLKTETRKFKIRTLESRQNALKITANSMYGALAAGGGKRLLIPAAACITSIGRDMLEKVRSYVISKGFEVIYGDTDSNIIKLPTSISPFIVHDSRIFSERLTVSLEQKGIPYSFENGTFVFPDQETVENLLKNTYAIDLKSSTLNVKTELESRACNIGKNLAKEITHFINEELHSNFDLEYENCFEHYILIGKKYYIGKKYSGEFVKKGVLSVKRVYAEIEKTIYDSVAATICQTDSHSFVIENLTAEINKIYTNSVLQDFIITTSFKSLRFYASKIDDGIYIDKNGTRFLSKAKLHPDMYFSKLPINAMVALKMHNRGELCPENSRIEYVFYDSDTKGTKGEMAIDFAYFFRNKEFLRLNRLAYIQRLVNPIDKLLETSNVAITSSASMYSFHAQLAEYFNIETPLLSDLVSIKTESRKFAIAETENVFKNLGVKYSNLEDISHVEEMLKNEMKIEVKATLIKSAIEAFERKLVPLCRKTIQCKDLHEQFIVSLCSSINSHFVLNKLYKKHKVKLSHYKTKKGVCFTICEIFRMKQDVIDQITNNNSIFKS